MRFDAETHDALVAEGGTNEMALEVAAVVENDDDNDADAQEADTEADGTKETEFAIDAVKAVEAVNALLAVAFAVRIIYEAETPVSCEPLPI